MKSQIKMNQAVLATALLFILILIAIFINLSYADDPPFSLSMV